MLRMKISVLFFKLMCLRQKCKKILSLKCACTARFKDQYFWKSIQRHFCFYPYTPLPSRNCLAIILDSVWNENGSLRARFGETFWARKIIFRLSVSENGEVYTPETSCVKRTSVYIKNTWIKQLCNHKLRNFATAFRVRKLFETFEKRAPALIFDHSLVGIVWDFIASWGRSLTCWA